MERIKFGPTNFRRPLIAAASGVVAATALVAMPATATADPPQMMPAPSWLPPAVDRAIPAPNVPKSKTIPRSALASGYDHRTLELRAAMLPSPTGDVFFDRWPADLGQRAPGQVIATRDVTRAAQIVVTAPISSATQVKFVSRDALGSPIFGTATLLVPRQPAPARGPRPILVNNVPIDALGAQCTAGYTLAHGFRLTTGVTDLIPPSTQLALARGYAVIVPDHQGPRMSYAEPTLAGRVILDSVRAAAIADPTSFGKGRIAMTGYSGGAIASHGAAKMLSVYARELIPRVAGIAIGGVPADFRVLSGSMNATLATGLFHAAMLGIARERPEILTLANNLAQQMAVSPMKDLCTIPIALMGQTFLPTQVFSKDPDPFRSPVANRIYTETKLANIGSPVPLYIFNGTQEWWIPAEAARNLYREQCRLGANARYREVFGEHGLAAVVGYPEALDWLDKRMRGIPSKSECRR
ncbi:putative lipase [Gordonia soli NBRC 108243]|uniref:Putative lipase n=2 Tax=Gordonia soli TaxID=320799 RepID=M0QS68_9ACTN|nr:putative lipase [Gordonia soli NBRC 108243]